MPKNFRGQLMCLNCKAPLTFFARDDTKYCSGLCKDRWWYRNHTMYKLGDSKRRNLGKACKTCGTRLPRYRHAYCSDKCRSIQINKRRVYRYQNDPDYKGRVYKYKIKKYMSYLSVPYGCYSTMSPIVL